MTTEPNPVRPVHTSVRTGVRTGVRRWRLLTAALVGLAAASAAQAQLTLPPPLSDPRQIDFAADPLLNFIASGTGSDDFTTAITAAVARNPRSAEARAGTDIARASQREARSALLPTLSASVNGSRSLAREFVDSSAVVERQLPRGRADATIGADQLLFDFGATGGRIAGAGARQRAASADADVAAASTTLDAITIWYQVAAFQALVELSDALVARHRGIAADTAARVAAGIGAGGDSVRAEAGLADAIGAASNSARSLASARARYRELFGQAAPIRPRLPQTDVLSVPSADYAIQQARSLPEVVSAEASSDAARAEARAVARDTLPRFSAGIAGTRFNIFGPGPNYDVRGQFLVRQSLSTGGAEAARASAADARARGAAAAADRIRAEAERNAEMAYADSVILDDAVTALASAYRANRRNRDITAEQFRQSRGSLIDLLRTESDYFASARALLQGSIERDLGRYTLLTRTGGLLRRFPMTPKP